jgi:hypothetical protein
MNEVYRIPGSPASFTGSQHFFGGKSVEIMQSVMNENIHIDTYRSRTNHDSGRRSEGSQAETATTALLRNSRGRRIHPATKGKTNRLGWLPQE